LELFNGQLLEEKRRIRGHAETVSFSDNNVGVVKERENIQKRYNISKVVVIE